MESRHEIVSVLVAIKDQGHVEPPIIVQFLLPLVLLYEQFFLGCLSLSQVISDYNAVFSETGSVMQPFLLDSGVKRVRDVLRADNPVVEVVEDLR